MNKTVMAQRLTEARGDERRETVAAAVKISVSALAMYETGQRVPRDEIKIALAEYYGLSIEFLFFTQ